MHPTFLGEVAREHVRSLVHEADAARLARAARAESPHHSLRHRVGLGMIALGERLAPRCPESVARVHGGRA